MSIEDTMVEVLQLGHHIILERLDKIGVLPHVINEVTFPNQDPFVKWMEAPFFLPSPERMQCQEAAKALVTAFLREGCTEFYNLGHPRYTRGPNYVEAVHTGDGVSLRLSAQSIKDVKSSRGNFRFAYDAIFRLPIIKPVHRVM